MRIVVLISGSGSNLQALLDACSDGRIQGQIVAVISNKAGVKGLSRAAAAGVPSQVLEHTHYPSREAFDAALQQCIQSHHPDLIVLAGFMRILTPEFVSQFEGKLINIHPSLLPKFPGLHTHQRALEAGETEHGASVHFVTGELDGGPIIIQGRVPVLPEDTAETLAARVLEQEHIIFPQAVQACLSGQVRYQNGCAQWQGQPLAPTGLTTP